jgi:hypothetical protein
VEGEVEINWQCQQEEKCGYIQPKMNLAKRLVHAAMEYPREEKVGKRECEAECRTREDGLANVTLGEM